MKVFNLFFIVLLMCFVSINTKAQEIDFGVKLGANFLTLEEADQLDNSIGFVGGAYLDLKFDKFGIQPEILYSQEGEQFDIMAFNHDYISIPVMFKFYMAGGLNFQIGPQFGFLVNDDIPNDIVNSLEANSFDLSAATGFGLDLPLGFRVSGRYVFDIENDLTSAQFDEGFVMLAVGFNLF